MRSSSCADFKSRPTVDPGDREFAAGPCEKVLVQGKSMVVVQRPSTPVPVASAIGRLNRPQPNGVAVIASSPNFAGSRVFGTQNAQLSGQGMVRF